MDTTPDHRPPTTDLMVEEAIAVLQKGGVIIYPTETLYGLGCDATNEDALRRLFEIKGRALTQPPPVLIAGNEQLQRLVSTISPAARELMDAHWPGALTIILPAQEGLSPLLTGENEGMKTVGVRETGHPAARALCERSNVPLVATSANFSGATGNAAAPCVIEDIPLELRQMVDYVLDSGPVGGAPSTIVDCTTAPFRVLRQGAVVLQK